MQLILQHNRGFNINWFCFDPNELFNRENTLLAAAGDGCIKTTFWAADDQLGKESSFSIHHSKISMFGLTPEDFER